MEMPSFQLPVIKGVTIFYAKTVILKGKKKNTQSSGTEHEYLLQQYLQMIYRFIYIKFNQ